MFPENLNCKKSVRKILEFLGWIFAIFLVLRNYLLSAINLKSYVCCYFLCEIEFESYDKRHFLERKATEFDASFWEKTF